MNLFISLLLWITISVALIGGWFYDGGKYRDAVKGGLLYVGTCAATGWALLKFQPTLQQSIWAIAAAGAVVVILWVFVAIRHISQIANTMAIIALIIILLYIFDQYTRLSVLTGGTIAAVIFFILMAITMYIHSKTAMPGKDK